MDHNPGPKEAQRGRKARRELAGRYSIGAPLSRIGKVRIFSATDLFLDRSVAVAFDNVEGGRSLATKSQAMAGIRSPHVVDVYDCGGNARYRFVVFERPASTIASLVQESDRHLWNEGRAIASAKELVVGLSHLHRAGVETSGLHLGSIGVDGSGRVRLSPWPMAELASVGADASNPANDLELVASVLEYGARVTGSAASSSAEILAARLRRLAGDGAQLSTAQLLEALAALEPSERDKTTGQVPVTQVSANAMQFSPKSPPHIYRRRRRSRWPVAAGGVLSVLVLLVLLGPGSQTALPSASGARPATVTCSSRPKACPANATSKAPRSAVTAPVPYALAAPVKTPGTSAAVNVVSPVAATSPTTTTTTPPPTTTTTTLASSAGSTGP